MVTPYIVFAGNCRKALEFYRTAFDSNIEMMRTYDEYIPERVINPPDNLSEWVLHAEMDICGTKFWFADEVLEPVRKGNMVKLTAQVDNAKKAQEIYNVLSKDSK